MSRDIERYGKVALYGIYFDSDRATIKPASDPALQEIAALLQNRPGPNLYSARSYR
jgi:outer membrane protein OmpA-like peptidoglycan-associated protein